MKNTKSHRKRLFALGVIIVLAVIMVPVLIHFVSKYAQINSPLSSDGVLSYFGTFFTAIISVIIAIGTYSYNRKKDEAEYYEKIEQRKKDICPKLDVRLNPIGDRTYEIILNNYSKYNAKDIYILDRQLLRFLGSDREWKGLISFSASDEVDVIEIYTDIKEYICYENYPYPKELFLVYLDEDNNTVCHDYSARFGDSSIEYELTNTIYC